MMHEMVSKAQRRLCSLIVLWPMKKKKDELLQQQNDNINSLENSLKNQDKQLSEIDKLQKTGKRKSSLSSRTNKT
jgi:hypothetical protein